MTIKLYQQDALEFLKTLPSASVDCIITDPAWESLQKWREVGTTTRLGGHHDPTKRREEMWFPTFADTLVPTMLKECGRVLKPGRHFYCFCDYTSLKLLVASAPLLWQYEKPLVWDKVAPGMGYHYRAQHEFVWFAVRAGGHETHVHDKGLADVLRAKRIVGGYPTEKPVELCRTFIMQSTEPGELVMDCFFGSGPVAVACAELDRSFVGCDSESRAVLWAKDRVLPIHDIEVTLKEGAEIPPAEVLSEVLV